MKHAHTTFDRQRGDTLIEVIMAMVILSIVIIGASALMNSGLRSSINAVEHTEVRNEIASQSELLRYIRDTFRADNSDAVSQLWRQLVDPAAGYATTSAASPVDSCTPPAAGKKPFYLTTTFVNVSQQPQLQLVDYTNSVNDPTRQYAIPGHGLWIEAVASTGADPAYVDFHMRSCWIGLGSTQPQRVNAIVRLYRPEGS